MTNQVQRSVRSLFALSAAAVAVVATSATASAHIDADPPAVQAGAAATVGFNVEHGCDGSPTTKLEFKVPDGVTDAKPVDKAGWTASTADGTVQFIGGPLDAAIADTFSISFTAPSTAGTILFPVIQTCAKGETAWVETAAEGQPEPEHPAPAVNVTSAPPTSDELTLPTDAPDASTPTAASGTLASGSASDSSTSDSVSSSDSNGDSSNTATVVTVVLAVVVVGAGVAAFILRRRGRS